MKQIAIEDESNLNQSADCNFKLDFRFTVYRKNVCENKRIALTFLVIFLRLLITVDLSNTFAMNRLFYEVERGKSAPNVN